jgi:hypothetical protein
VWYRLALDARALLHEELPAEFQSTQLTPPLNRVMIHFCSGTRIELHSNVAPVLL